LPFNILELLKSFIQTQDKGLPKFLDVTYRE